MAKDYFYKDYRYYYCRKYKMWIIDDCNEYIYCNSKKEVIDYIDFLIKEV